MSVFQCGDFFYRVPSAPLPKGAVVYGHKHNYGHVTDIRKGGFRIEAWDGEIVQTPTGQVDEHGIALTKAEIIGLKIWDKEHWANGRNGVPYLVWIKPNLIHKFTSLAGGSVYWCIYLGRDEEGNAIPYNGWEEAVN